LKGQAVPRSIRAHFEHHKRFYAAAALGILIWTVTWMFALPVHLAVAGDAFFLVYLLSMLGMAHRARPSEMRTRAAVKDEGIVLIVLITLAAIGLRGGFQCARRSWRVPAGASPARVGR
jgi:uncharacterized membrane protein